MSKTMTIKFTPNTLSRLHNFIGRQLSTSDSDSSALDELRALMTPLVNLSHLQAFKSQIESWWARDKSYLAINCADRTGLSLRLYRSDYQLEGDKLRPSGSKLASMYLRYRDAVSSKLKTVSLGRVTIKNCKELIESADHILASNCLGIRVVEERKAKEHQEVDSSTLEAFVWGQYLEAKRYDNPKSAELKCKIIARYFKPLLQLPLANIDAELVRAWMRSKERKLTNRQLAADESIWSLKPSTMKEAICTLRACVQLAKELGLIRDHDLYSLPRIRVDNQIIRYLSVDEELKLFEALNSRNREKLEQRHRTIEHRQKRHIAAPANLDDCAFADHLSPFIILFKETGIRPGTIMNSRWGDIDFEGRFFRIRKSLDKRNVSNFVPLNDLALLTLKEWRKHHLHKLAAKHFRSLREAWLFPSSLDPANQLTTIKKSWNKLLKSAGIEDFRLYDLRHDFASKVMMQTGNIYMVSQLLNHQQIETTKRYSHLMDESRFDAVRSLDKHRTPGAWPEL